MPQELLSLTDKKIALGTTLNLSDNIVVCLSGIGQKNTHSGVAQLVQQPVDLLISWGSAAGLRPDLAAGDLLVPQFIKVENRQLPTSDSFNKLLISKLPHTMNIHYGPVSECKRILANQKDKANLFQSSGCIAADMESGLLARRATELNIPFAVIRSVSDPADMSLPKALTGSFQNEIFQPWNFFSKALLNPAEWLLITKLMSNFKKAKKSLIIAGSIIKAYSGTWT